MKKLIRCIALLFIFTSSPALAAPFLVCDPYPPSELQPDYFWVKMDALAEVKSPAVDVTGGKILKYDLAGVSVGDHRVEVRACQASDAWGEVCSSPAVFTFRRPSAPSSPTLKITR